jgi:predicted RNase H-like HicB family nuclease
MTTARDYPIVVFWSQEDEAYIADVPDVVFCSAWGATPEEALREARLALADILDDASDRGIVLPPPTLRPKFAKAS